MATAGRHTTHQLLVQKCSTTYLFTNTLSQVTWANKHSANVRGRMGCCTDFVAPICYSQDTLTGDSRWSLSTQAYRLMVIDRQTHTKRSLERLLGDPFSWPCDHLSDPISGTALHHFQRGQSTNTLLLYVQPPRERFTPQPALKNRRAAAT